MTEIPKDKIIILFDGVCNLCESSVQFILKHDSKDVFRFTSLQSEIGFSICNKLNINTKEIDSILYFEPENVIFYKSKAAFKIAKKLNFPYKFIAIFSILPVFFTDMIYDFIAKNRYKWFGKKDSCMIPTKELLQKFL